ncbi:MAG: helix-turn-helix transcriptional regulator [Armatimonadetes bacterium]|nr:metalloregulator ArsR/SmtB family transcription factor [Armatimonadota bacterium]MBS1701225.1 helix-turn-helix transcriptional regulator [Armatimonadota bacterium]MBS1728531.1 helix-turn-helix transcriptional regulator [Armatimonadota bacterium]
MSAQRSEIYQALGDPARLTMIERLGDQGPMTTMKLVEGLGMSRQAATKHLLVLENVGLVSSTAKGREVIRELRLEVLDDAASWLSARARAWDRKLGALQKFLEEG